MTVRDKCKQPIKPVPQSDDKGAIVIEKDAKVTFSFYRYIRNKFAFEHKVVLDICPACQEQMLSEMLGAPPWPKGE